MIRFGRVKELYKEVDKLKREMEFEAIKLRRLLIYLKLEDYYQGHQVEWKIEKKEEQN